MTVSTLTVEQPRRSGSFLQDMLPQGAGYGDRMEILFSARQISDLLEAFRDSRRFQHGCGADALKNVGRSGEEDRMQMPVLGS